MDRIEPRVHKDTNNYTPRYYFGLTARQIFASVLIVLTEVPLYLYLITIIGDDNASWVIVFSSIPIVGWGFIKIQGMNAEMIIKNIFRNYFIYSKPLIYKTEAELQQEKEKKRFYKLRKTIKEKIKFKKKEERVDE